MLPGSTLIISTYNWPEALELCLHSILQQKHLPDEVIVADDGSKAPTREVIEAFAQKSPVPVKHIWHEDDGFRLAAIRNKAIAAARYAYIIQIDGDIVMHPWFIADHLRFARENTFVRASRIYMDATLSKKKLLKKETKIKIWEKGVSNVTSAVRCPFLWRRFATTYKNTGAERYEIHGCNMAFWKKDAIKVNGYNEDFVGWGPEDKEFVARLLNSGMEKRFLKLGGIAFHIFHEENVKNRLSQNEYLMKEAIEQEHIYCKNGLNKYLK